MVVVCVYMCVKDGGGGVGGEVVEMRLRFEPLRGKSCYQN